MEIKVYEKLPLEAKMIRKKVFMEEQGFDNEFDDIDDISTHIVIWESSEPVATSRFYYCEERQCYVIGRVAVRKEFRGKDYGAQLLKMSEKEIMERLGETVELSAQVRASAFYIRNGYLALDELYDDEGCPHVWMRKKLK